MATAKSQEKSSPKTESPKTESPKAETPPDPAPAQSANGKTEAVSWEKKLTTKIVLAKKVHAGLVEKGPVKLYSIIGMCTGTKVGESQYGGWVGFLGDFEAVRFSDGKVFRSPIAFIPEPASGMILAALSEARRKAGETSDPSVGFAFIVGAKQSDSAIGFEYTVEPVMKAEQNDALAEFRKLMQPKLPQLTHAAS